MRWLWFVLSMLCFAVSFRTHSMGLAAITLLAALGFLLMGTLAMAAGRIESRTRDASVLMRPDEVRRLAEIERRKREAAAAPAATPPTADDADLDSVPGDHPKG